MFAFENGDDWGCGVFSGAISIREYGGQSIRLVGLSNGIAGMLTSITSSNGHSDTPTRISFGNDLPVTVVQRFESKVTPPMPVPEPASWALMLAGFAAAGTQLRLRRPAGAPRTVA